MNEHKENKNTKKKKKLNVVCPHCVVSLALWPPPKICFPAKNKMCRYLPF